MRRGFANSAGAKSLRANSIGCCRRSSRMKVTLARSQMLRRLFRGTSVCGPTFASCLFLHLGQLDALRLRLLDSAQIQVQAERFSLANIFVQLPRMRLTQ